MAVLALIRGASVSLTQKRDCMMVGPAAPEESLPADPTLPPMPQLPTARRKTPRSIPGFFDFLTRLVGRIKEALDYDLADGVLLGIAGSEMPAADSAIVPQLEAVIRTSGKPELTCKKGIFQGYNVWLARSGGEKKNIGFSSSRHFMVEEPLPAAGVAEVWNFEVQSRYKDAPFGQVSQPFGITVRG